MTLFTKIIKGEIPSFKIYEDDRFFAFLDINPIQEGHTLLIPKLPEPECDYIFDLDDDTLSSMMKVAKKIAKAMKQTLGCKRVGMAVLGMEVNHVHIHLIPLNKESDMLFNRPKLKLSDERMRAIAETISQAII